MAAGDGRTQVATAVPATSNGSSSQLPLRAGVGLRHPHVLSFLEERPATAFLEVHSENYLGTGGPRRRALFDLARDYPLSFHGVGLSLGSAEGLDPRHLERLGRLFAEYQPTLISEHLSWSVAGGSYLNDLLPLPYTEEALDLVCRNVDAAQTAFGRRILLENPSSYLQFRHSSIPEAEFLAAIQRRTGCGLLLDVNNVYVSAENHGLDALAYLSALPAEAVEEIHLAGHARRPVGDQVLLIDDHGSAVPAAVWQLYEAALALTGPRPTLIEWDCNIPQLSVLLAEAAKADRRLIGLTAAEGQHVA